MHNENHSTASGEVTEIFAHRFVVRTPTGSILADLGPKGIELFALKRGDHVELTGEQKPSELKVRRITSGGRSVALEHKQKDNSPGPHGDDRNGHPPGDPDIAVAAVRTEGFEVVGRPRRKPNHFEVLGKNKGGGLFEFHVALDGAIRKAKPIAPADDTWTMDAATSA